jgi:copper chaperone
MREKRILVLNVSCGHCAMTIKREIGHLPGVASVDVDVESKEATVHWNDPTRWFEIADKLSEIGYSPSP